MRVRRFGVMLTAVVLGAVIIIFAIPDAKAATFVVSKVADTNDGTCDADCSLREAIVAANAAGGADTINFNIPGTGLHTIQPTSAFPAIVSPVTINGYSQPGSSANTAVSPYPLNGTLTIELDGQLAGSPNVNGLLFDSGSSGSTVRGLIINRFSFDGISFQTTSNNTIAGNYIGVDSTGMIDRGNGARGVGASTGAVSSNNTIGGTNPEDRNISSGNDDGGGPTGNEGIGGCDVCQSWTVQGNYVGIGKDGQTVIANEGSGLSSGVGTTGHLFGGIAAGATNVVAGNAPGVSLTGSEVFISASSSLINNIIGTDYTGTLDIGGTSVGVTSNGNDNTFQGNTIKYNNNAGIILIANNGTLIGGDETNEANIITNNGGGVFASSFAGSAGLNHSIIGNKIADNSGGALSSLGIDLLGSTNDFATFTNLGVTTNDAGDADVLSNHLMNFPVISSITSSNGSASITYSLDINDSESGATGYRIEFFANDSADSSGYGEGQTFLGHDTVSGDVTNRTATITLPSGVSGAKFIAATTTMTDNSTDGFGHTSEFSAYFPGTLFASTTAGNAGSLANTGLNIYAIIAVGGALLVTGGWLLRVAHSRY